MRIQKVLSEGVHFRQHFFEGREDPNKYHYTQAIINPPAKHHLMAFRWHADNGPKLIAGSVALRSFRLGSFVIFQAIGTSVAKKPYIFVMVGGSGPPASLWIRPCTPSFILENPINGLFLCEAALTMHIDRHSDNNL